MIGKIPPPTWRPNNREYHADPRWSSSRFGDFLESPRQAHGLYVTGEIPRPEPSEGMLKGSALNILLLQPELEGTIHVVPVAGRKTKAVTDATALYPNKLVVTEPEMEAAQEMAKAILRPQTRAAEVAKALLTNPNGYPEYAHRWDDPAGVPCKVMVDHLGIVRYGGQSGPFVTELKSTRETTEADMAKAYINLSYDRQAGWNRRGITNALGGVVPGSIVVFVSSSEKNLVGVWVVPQRIMSEGTAIVDEGIVKLGECLRGERGWVHDFEALELNGGALPELPVPYWYGRRERPTTTASEAPEPFVYDNF